MMEMTAPPSPQAPASPAAPLAALLLSNLLGGLGIASGITVGALLVSDMGGVELAGASQALAVLGAAAAAVPLAHLAARRGRRASLGLGYAVAAAGAALIIIGASLGWLLLVLVGMAAFGFASATNLQSRYAASEVGRPSSRGLMLSVVVWATTLGSVVGPQLSPLGADIATSLRMYPLSGPYLFAAIGFVVAGLIITALYRVPLAPAQAPTPSAISGPRVGSFAALRWAMRHPVTRFAVALLVGAHAMMVAIMTMAPLFLAQRGYPLPYVGWVISLHILGMYALSPLFGWLCDQAGPVWVAIPGLAMLAVSAAYAMVNGGNILLVGASLVLLGLGWSACTIAASALLASVDVGELRVPLQGGTDALMNYAGALAALASGPLLLLLGYGGLALVAALLTLPAATLIRKAALEVARMRSLSLPR